MLLLEVDVPDERLKLGASRDGHVERLGGEESLEVKQVEVVVVHQVGEQLVGQTVQRGHHGQGELPAPVRRSIHVSERKR